MKHQHFRTYSGEDSTCQCRRCNKRCGFDPWVGKIRWRRNGHPLQVFFLEKSMDRGAFWATVHGVTNSQTRLSNWGHVCVRARAHTHTSACVLSCFSSIWLLATLCSIAHLNSQPMGFSRQEYWSGLPFHSPNKSTCKLWKTSDSPPSGFFFNIYLSKYIKTEN